MLFLHLVRMMFDPEASRRRLLVTSGTLWNSIVIINTRRNYIYKTEDIRRRKRVAARGWCSNDSPAYFCRVSLTADTLRDSSCVYHLRCIFTLFACDRNSLQGRNFPSRFRDDLHVPKWVGWTLLLLRGYTLFRRYLWFSHFPCTRPFAPKRKETLVRDLGVRT